MRGKVPAEVFTTVYTNPVNGNAENVRNNRRESLRLFKEAGFEIKDQKLVDPSGKQVSVEFLIQQDPSSERLVLFYKPALERLGINVSVRAVDNVQYQNRAAQLRLRHHHRRLGPVALARQRAARVLGIARRRPAGLAKHASASRIRPSTSSSRR